jgi:hypothetical protein
MVLGYGGIGILVFGTRRYMPRSWTSALGFNAVMNAFVFLQIYDKRYNWPIKQCAAQLGRILSHSSIQEGSFSWCVVSNARGRERNILRHH